MPSDLKDILTSSKPRETSGSRSSNRFDFQKNWAICKLIDLHEKNTDYLIIFDYHEDIIVLDSETSPEIATFFQIKTKKNKCWTISQLIKKTKNKEGKILDDSILDKLFYNHNSFKDSADNLIFESNQGVSTKLIDKSAALDCDSFTFSQLNINDKEKIHKCLEGNTIKVSDIKGLSKFKFTKTNLSLNDHTSHSKGRLVEFLDKLFPGKNISITPAYNSLFDEVRRRTNEEQLCNNFDDILNKKGMGKSEFESILNLFNEQAETFNLWNETNYRLISEQCPQLKINNIRYHWKTYLVNKMDASNEDLHKLSNIIKRILIQIWITSPNTKLIDLAREIRKKDELKDHINIYNDEYLDTVIIYEAMHNDSIQKTNSEYSEETR